VTLPSRAAGAVLALGLSFAGSESLAQERRDDPPPPPPRSAGPREAERGGPGGPQRYSLAQAVSDQAQLHTIAFDGLAFLTGDFGAATFLPPGKVCDFFGFQYMRDIDTAAKGHNPIFIDRVAGNVLKTLNEDQRGRLASLARQQAGQFDDLARRRWPVIQVFFRELSGDVPPGSLGLDRDAVKRHVGDIFAFDADLSYRRAEVFGQVISSLTAEQRASLAQMKFGDFTTWPEVDVEAFKLPRGTKKAVNVAYMTYASELFSWSAGSLAADVYFCPERHGTYFGAFYLKDMPAMNQRDYDIGTSVTGDSGKEFLNLLTAEQRAHVTGILDRQRRALQEIVDVRRAISAELRKYLEGGQADHARVLALGRRYGELDGELSYCYATAFAKVDRTLTEEQRRALVAARGPQGYAGAPAYIYSDPVQGQVTLPDTDHFFFPEVVTVGRAKQ
jgi:Spy/CpxP family protein refolding chaperone